jgi:predicted lipid-binding transport protein (Tim44 family)
MRPRASRRRKGALPRGPARGALCIAGTLTATLAMYLLASAPAALARSGSGSSGFGRGFGGGGGGGGLGRAFGRGHFFFIPVGGGSGILVVIVIAVLVLYVLPRITMWWRGQQSRGRASRRRVSQRERRVELAAAEASEDDAAFAPDVVRPAATRLFLDIQSAWNDGDREQLRGLVAPGLMAEWQLRLDDLGRRGWRNRVKPLGDPKVSYVGLKNTGDDSSDRVVVRVEATLLDYVEDSYGQRIGRLDNLSDTSKVREYWTLGKRDGRWILLSIEQGAEGEHALAEELVASPWSDDRAMRDQALVEGAVADAVPEGTRIAEVADLDFQGDARAAALDLSLADGRFAPDLLEIAARRAVAAWAEAVDGEDSALLAIAHPQAAQHLLHPGDPSEKTRLVVRGPRVKQIRITALDAAATPPSMSIEVDIEGKRYLEDRDTAAVVAGVQSRSSSFTEHWTLVLDGDSAEPWRIAAVGTPIGYR